MLQSCLCHLTSQLYKSVLLSQPHSIALYLNRFVNLTSLYNVPSVMIAVQQLRLECFKFCVFNIILDFRVGLLYQFCIEPLFSLLKDYYQKSRKTFTNILCYNSSMVGGMGERKVMFCFFFVDFQGFISAGVYIYYNNPSPSSPPSSCQNLKKLQFQSVILSWSLKNLPLQTSWQPGTVKQKK